MRLAEIGTEIWCGDFLACNARVVWFPLAVHIWSDANKQEGRVCRHVTEGRPDHLSVRYSEAESLAAMSVTTDAFLRYCAQPGKLLVHCAGGAHRSTTLTILALIARGVRPHEAVSRMFAGVWGGYGVFPTVTAQSINEIFAVAGCPCPWDAPPTGRDWP